LQTFSTAIASCPYGVNARKIVSNKRMYVRMSQVRGNLIFNMTSLRVNVITNVLDKCSSAYAEDGKVKPQENKYYRSKKTLQIKTNKKRCKNISERYRPNTSLLSCLCLLPSVTDYFRKWILGSCLND